MQEADPSFGTSARPACRLCDTAHLLAIEGRVRPVQATEVVVYFKSECEHEIKVYVPLVWSRGTFEHRSRLIPPRA